MLWHKVQGAREPLPPEWLADMSAVSYDSKSFNTGLSDSRSQAFKLDGTKLYVLDQGINVLRQYSLSTAWDISTASYDSVSFNFTTQDSDPHGIFIRDDGNKLYMVGLTNDKVYEYDLTTPWDASTLTYTTRSISVASSLPTSVFFKPNGKKMYVTNFNQSGNDGVLQYSLSTAWDVSTASYDSTELVVTSQEAAPTSAYFSPNGDKLYVTGFFQNTVFQYNMTTPWELSTASYSSLSASVLRGNGLRFKPNGDKMYVMSTNGTIYQYTSA